MWTRFGEAYQPVTCSHILQLEHRYVDHITIDTLLIGPCNVSPVGVQIVRLLVVGHLKSRDPSPYQTVGTRHLLATSRPLYIEYILPVVI